MVLVDPKHARAEDEEGDGVLLPTLTTSTPSAAAVRSTDGSKRAPQQGGRARVGHEPHADGAAQALQAVISSGGSAYSRREMSPPSSFMHCPVVKREMRLLLPGWNPWSCTQARTRSGWDSPACCSRPRQKPGSKSVSSTCEAERGGMEVISIPCPRTWSRSSPRARRRGQDGRRP